MPVGFKANGVSAGIKKSGKLDLALFYSISPAKAACLFTTNKIQAAPVKIDKKRLKQSKHFRAVLVNSGVANCFTGPGGIRDAQDCLKELAKCLKINPKQLLAVSTGVIGKRLPLLKIKRALPSLAGGLSQEGIDKAKVAIMTTDTFTKEASVKFNLGNKAVSICGIAKGAGMIAPNLATMLCFIFTDASVTSAALKRALRNSVDNSFNCITVDGCMSTNDTVILLSNATAGNTLVDTGAHFNLFQKALNVLCLELAKLLVKDAEGATKFIRIKVSGAANFNQAKKAALSVANSNLFKTAVYGESHNFGRIAAALGASGVEIDEARLKVKVSPLRKKEISVDISLGFGRGCAVVYTSDLSPEYIRINAEYS